MTPTLPMPLREKRFSREALAKLRAHRARVQVELEEYRAVVRTLSEGRLHSQACPVGGMHIMGGSSLDGGPCWCGADEPEPARGNGHDQG